MAVPEVAKPEDFEKIAGYLGRRSTGSPIADAEATLGKGLFDKRRRAAYAYWGVLDIMEESVSFTERGRRFADSDDQVRSQIYADILREKRIYNTTLEFFHTNPNDEITATQVGTHWTTHFKSEVSSREAALRRQAVCFLRLVDAAGIGEFKLGRNKLESRLTVNPQKLAAFVAGKSHVVQEPKSSIETESPVVEVPESGGSTNEAASETFGRPSKPSTLPSLHVDVQVHIHPDTEDDKIEKIFKSMAKYVYGMNVD